MTKIRKAPARAPEDVVLGWVHPGDVTNIFMDSVLRTIGYDRGIGGRRIAGWNAVQCSANVSSGRNSLVEWFLETPANWLMMIDTDMCWEADAVHRLLDVAHPDRMPVVGGLCFAQEADTGRIWSTMFDLGGTEDDPQFVRYDSWPDDTLVEVVGTGAAFLLIHRKAAEAVRDRAFSATFPYFQERELAGRKVGEDVTFCMRVRQAGLPVFVHTGVTTGHRKTHIVTLDTYRAQMAILRGTGSIEPVDRKKEAA